MIQFNDCAAGLAIMRAAGGSGFSVETETCISRHREGMILGGFVYGCCTGPGGSVEMHVAGFTPGWLSRELLALAFDYPFEQLGVAKIFSRVGATNIQSIQLVLHLGGKEETRLQGVYPDEDALVFSMKRTECRWLAVKPRSYRRG